MTPQASANQQKLNRLMAEAEARYARTLTIGATRTDRRGTARWNGAVWVYGR